MSSGLSPVLGALSAPQSPRTGWGGQVALRAVDWGAVTLGNFLNNFRFTRQVTEIVQSVWTPLPQLHLMLASQHHGTLIKTKRTTLTQSCELQTSVAFPNV